MKLEATAYRERFEVGRVLGEGGMGIVYEAFDRVRNETVALKTLRRADADAIYRLKREFRSLATIEHPNLVRLYDLFVTGDGCFFTMERITGVDLATYVSARDHSSENASTVPEAAFRPFDEAAIRHGIAGLVRGLDALHKAGLLHRDLKPSNVMVTPQGRVVLLDFGLVVDAHAAVQQTIQGAVTGTVAYMAPEQARGVTELTAACDLYAVGVILYELLSGRLPFEGPVLRLMLAKQTEDPPRVARSVPSVPEDLDSLASALMDRDPAARPRIPQVLEALGVTHASRARTTSPSGATPRLVGRQAELASLDEAYRRSHGGRPTIVLVRGRSGIGKSALLQSFAREVEASRAVVLSGRCYESESVPFKGLDGIVDSLSRFLAMSSSDTLGRLLPPNLGDLATLFPVLRRVKPLAAAFARRALAEQSVQRTRSQGFACLRELMRRLGETTPLLVVLDDVQWADDDSARGLVELVRGDSPPSMMLLLGARTEGEGPVIRDLFGSDVGEAISALDRTALDLAPLPMEAMREIARRELGADEHLIELVARDSHGVPFAAGELARFLREGEVDEATFESGAPIDAVVRRRVEMLGEAGRRVLQMVAIAGEPTPSSVVLQALALDDDDRAPVDELRERAFVRGIRSGSAVMLDTAHDRIRESVLESLDASLRADLHLRLALVLEGLETPPHDRLARHFAIAGERSLGRLHAAAAAEDASRALAFLRAAELYALALDLSREDDRPSLLVPYAQALASAGRYADAAVAWLEAAARRSGADAREFRRRAAECWLYAGRIDEGLDLLDMLAGEVGVRIPQHRWTVWWELVKGQIHLAIRGLGFRPRPSSDTGSVELDRVRTLGAIAVQYGPLDPFRGAVPTLRYLLAALELGDRDELTTALGFEAVLRSALGWRSGALRLLSVLGDLSSDSSSGKGRTWAAMSHSFLAINVGDRAEAQTCSAQAFEHMAGLAAVPPWLLSLAHYIDGFSLMFDLRTASFGRVLAFVEEREERSGPCSELRLRASALQAHHLLVGRPEAVLAMVDDARWTSATRRDVTFRTVAETYAPVAHLYLGDPHRALVVAHRVRDAYRRQGMWRNTMARGAALWFLAACGLAIGDRQLVRRCVRELGRATDDHLRLYECLLLAMAARTDGRDQTCVSMLLRLRALAESRSFPLFELLACWGLGHLAPEPASTEARRRYIELVTGTGMVDPDLVAWSRLPIGERPERTGAPQSIWSRAAANPVELTSGPEGTRAPEDRSIRSDVERAP